MFKKIQDKTIRGRITETAFKTLFLLSALFSILAVVAIAVFLFIRGVPALNKIGLFKFLSGREWMPKADVYGILPMIAGSLYATAGAVLLGGTVGIFTAIFLAKFCPRKIKTVLTQIINLLAGIPSVVFGFFGLAVLSKFLGRFSANGSGLGVLCVSIVLGIMILPTVVSLSKTSIEAVDNSYFEGAVALGATKERAVFKVVVPAAKSGIFASMILGVGRALGETMAVAMVAGGRAAFPKNLLTSFRTMTANIVMEMSYANGLHLEALIATGVVLFVFILIINIAFNLIKNKGGGRGKGGRRKINIKFLPVAGKYFSYLAAALGVVSLAAVVLFILIKGIPSLSLQLLFGKYVYGGANSILPSIITTVMLVALASIIAFPLGIFTAIFLTEYTKKGSKSVKIIRLAVETLGAIPSIVYGLFGMLFFCGVMKLGTTILAGCLTVSIMIIPTTVRSVEESLKSVPDSLREGSFALGAGKLRTIYKVILPSALPGILAAVILGIGRMIGESAPIVFTSGSTIIPAPKGYRSAGPTLAVALYALAREGLHMDEAYAAACVLIVLVLILNTASALLAGRLQKKLAGKKA